MNKGKSLLLAGLSFLMLATPALAEDVIRLGVPGAHTGDLASYGIPTLNAANLVADEYNAKGGINGKKIVVIAQDDQCKPELATNAATKLVSDKVDIVLGHICSGATKAALPIYTSTKLIAMSPSATTPNLTTSGDNPYFFRTIANDNLQARLSASFVLDKLNAKKIAIIHDNGEYGKGFAETNKMLIEKAGKGEIVLFEAVNPDAVDYGATVKKLKREKADVIIFGGYHPTASKLVQQMKRDRVRAPFVAPDGVKDDTFIKMAGKDAEGVFASSPSDTSKLPSFQKAREQHLAKYKSEPGAFFYTAYAAAQALLNAVEKSGGTDPAKIMEVLRSQTVETPAGVIKFDKNGDPIGVGLSMYEVKGGKYVETDNKIIID